ncbi:MAG: hypothetical protein IJ875_05015 [Solobacterium sp.]|nr:hypothetical protein [Solobacterium sp.]
MTKIKQKKWLVVLLLSLFVWGCKATSASTKSDATITNTVEVETAEADMKGYSFVRDPIASYIEIPLKDLTKLINEGGSGLVYMGYDTCDWCNRAFPELNAVLQEYNFTTYYVNSHSEHFVYTSSDVDEMFKALEPVLNEDGNLYVPLVLGVKNGEIVGFHSALVEDYHATDIKDPNDQMSDAQKEELRNIYKEIIEKTID